MCRDDLFGKSDRLAAALNAMNTAFADAAEQEYWDEMEAEWEAELEEEEAESNDIDAHDNVGEEDDDVEDFGDDSEATVDVHNFNKPVRKIENVKDEDDEKDLEK
jgi:hypothetical protein